MVALCCVLLDNEGPPYLDDELAEGMDWEHSGTSPPPVPGQGKDARQGRQWADDTKAVWSDVLPVPAEHPAMSVGMRAIRLEGVHELLDGLGCEDGAVRRELVLPPLRGIKVGVVPSTLPYLGATAEWHALLRRLNLSDDEAAWMGVPNG